MSAQLCLLSFRRSQFCLRSRSSSLSARKMTSLWARRRRDVVVEGSVGGPAFCCDILLLLFLHCDSRQDLATRRRVRSFEASSVQHAILRSLPRKNQNKLAACLDFTRWALSVLKAETDPSTVLSPARCATSFWPRLPAYETHPDVAQTLWHSAQPVELVQKQRAARLTEAARAGTAFVASRRRLCRRLRYHS